MHIGTVRTPFESGRSADRDGPLHRSEPHVRTDISIPARCFEQIRMTAMDALREPLGLALFFLEFSYIGAR